MKGKEQVGRTIRYFASVSQPIWYPKLPLARAPGQVKLEEEVRLFDRRFRVKRLTALS